MSDDTLEQQVGAVLQAQAEGAVVPPPDPTLFLARAQPRGAANADQGRNRLLLLAAIAGVAVVVGGAAILWASPGTLTRGPAAESPPVPELDRPFDFDTQVGVRLRAAEVTVDTGGQTFSPLDGAVDVEVIGDPGHPAAENESGYTTLELTWFEHDVEMRIYLYFASDNNDWWVDEIRTYDGAAVGEWIEMSGEYFRTPIGQPFIGDLDVGPLHIGGMVLEGFSPRRSTCDGSGPPGRPFLELSGPRPVAGSVGDGGRGYATRVAVLDASTCEPLVPDCVEFQATIDSAIAVVEPATRDGLVFDPSWAPGELYVGVTFTGPGETFLTIEAVDLVTGNVVATVDIPVTVSE